MASERKPLIAIFGATGSQGGGVLRALKAQGRFRTRAITRSAEKAQGLGADEIVEADLTKPDTLPAAMEGAHGVFLVTNFWEGQDVDEYAQGKAAVEAAKQAGVQHFVWSTLPNVEALTDGALEVVHFTEKARVDEVVDGAAFPNHTFVEAPFYYQNLVTLMAPQPQDDGSLAWYVPMDPDARVIHMGDVHELGNVVAGAFARPDRVGDGAYLSHAGGLYSWNDVVRTLRDQGHDVQVQQVPAEAYDDFYPGAREMREMMEYFEAHTYMGPDAEEKLALAREVAISPPTPFAEWARENVDYSEIVGD